MRIGDRQLETLVALGSPTMSLVVPGKECASLIKGGLLQVSPTGGFACITATGLTRATSITLRPRLSQSTGKSSARHGDHHHQERKAGCCPVAARDGHQPRRQFHGPCASHFSTEFLGA